MPDCGLMFSSQQKNVGGNHDNFADLSRSQTPRRRFRPPQAADRRSGACGFGRDDEDGFGRLRPAARPDRRANHGNAALPLGPLSGARYPTSPGSMKKPSAGTMAVERVATGFRWAEGLPFGRAIVLFSGIPQQSHHAGG
jgi:hypothetical protein